MGVFNSITREAAEAEVLNFLSKVATLTDSELEEILTGLFHERYQIEDAWEEEELV